MTLASPASTSSVGSSLAQIAGLTALLVAAFAGVSYLVRWFSGELRTDRAARRRARPGHTVAEPSRRALAAVAADVRRLNRELAGVPSGAAQARRRGLLAAYDDVLIEAAEQLEVPQVLGSTPAGSGRDLERMRLLASLEAAGLVLEP